MQPDRSRQQAPEIQREEMSPASSNELQPFALPSEEDQQQEDRPFAPEKNCRTVNPRQTSNTYKNNLLLKDIWDKQIICDRSELFNQTMKCVSNVESELSRYALYAGILIKPHRESYHKKQKGQERQYAFAVIFWKDGKYWTSDVVYPHHRNKKRKNSASPSSEVTSHSEEILIPQIDEVLQNNGTNVQNIVIYTYNSPCLKREKNIDPCMFKLLESAHQWHSKYGIFTDVVFTNYWGLSGPNVFGDLTYSDISSPSSDFYPYIETCNKIPFQLDHKDFKNILKNCIPKKTLLCVEESERNKLVSEIKSFCKELMANSSFGLSKDHLDCGGKKISSLILPLQIQDKITKCLKDNWEKMVNNSSMSPIREKVTTDFNSAVVHLFLKYLQSTVGNCSPLQLYLVPAWIASEDLKASGKCNFIPYCENMLN